MIDLEKKSGKYTGNGTSQEISIGAVWTKLEIMSADRKYIMTYFKDDAVGETVGQAAIGSGGSFRQLAVTAGGVSQLNNGFTVGDHISINELEIEYYWSVS